MVHMESERLIRASEELFQVEDDIHDLSYERLPFETADARAAMSADGLSMGAALGEATVAWLEGRIAPTRSLMTNLAEFVVVHSQTVVAIDEFYGTEFDRFAHLVHRPGHNPYADLGLSPEGW